MISWVTRVQAGVKHVLAQTRLGNGICLTALGLLATAVPAAAEQFGDFTYEKTAAEVTITGYTGSGGVVVITNEIDFLPVTSIGDSAFYGCSGLTDVTLPDSVTNLGSYAFQSCVSLTNAMIGVLSIGEGAFADCASLATVMLGTNVASLGHSAFSGCATLASVTVPVGVTNIGDSAFESCTSLTNVTIGAKVAQIGAFVFAWCPRLIGITVDALNPFYCSVDGIVFDKSLTRLVQCPGARTGDYTVSNSVCSVGSGAFYSCTNLGSVTIPHSVTNIGSSAFSRCSGLTAISVAVSNSYYSSVDGVLFDKGQTLLLQCPGSKAGDYTVSNSVTGIGGAAFAFCSALTGVTLPDSVASIERSAFNNCTGLVTLWIGSGVTNIGSSAFNNCRSLTEVTIPGSVTSVGTYAFSSCRSLTRVTIPSSVTSLGRNAFRYCLSLTSVTIPGSVTSIGSDAFDGCSGLTIVYFKGDAPSLGLSVFPSGNPATVFYLPGTTGWGTKFGGRPTALWRPQIQGDATFGVQANHFGFCITNAGSPVVVVEACTDLSASDWTPVGTNTLTGGTASFVDPAWTNHPARFYRLSMP